ANLLLNCDSSPERAGLSFLPMPNWPQRSYERYFFLIEFLHWLSENYTWVFSGVGVSALAVAVWFLREYVFRKPNVLGVRQSNAVNTVRVVTFIELTAKSHPPSSIRLCGLSISGAGDHAVYAHSGPCSAQEQSTLWSRAPSPR